MAEVKKKKHLIINLGLIDSCKSKMFRFIHYFEQTNLNLIYKMMKIIYIKIYIKTVKDYFHYFHFINLMAFCLLAKSEINMKNWKQLMKPPTKLYYFI